MAKLTKPTTTALMCSPNCPQGLHPPLSENMPPRKMEPLNSSFLTLGLLFRSLPWVSDTLKSVCSVHDTNVKVHPSTPKRTKSKWHRKSSSRTRNSTDKDVFFQELSEKIPEPISAAPCIVVTDVFGNSVMPNEEELEESTLSPSSSTFFDEIQPAIPDERSWLSVFEPHLEDDSESVGSEGSDSSEGGYMEEEDRRFLESLHMSRSIHLKHFDFSMKPYDVEIGEDGVDIDTPEMDPFFSPFYSSPVASLADQSFPSVLQVYVARHCQGTFGHSRRRRRRGQERDWVPPGPSSLRFQVEEDLVVPEFLDSDISPCSIPLPEDDDDSFDDTQDLEEEPLPDLILPPPCLSTSTISFPQLTDVQNLEPDCPPTMAPDPGQPDSSLCGDSHSPCDMHASNIPFPLI